jgi:tRNA dimethylallyltransferase
MIAAQRHEPPFPVVILFGPTAVGKSELLSSCLDERFEIISADSMQVYRHMDIGTAKPSPEERQRIRHHLIDIADPCEQFNAGRFVKEAERLASSVAEAGHVPVVSGGTAFYITSFIFGLPEAPAVDPAIRERFRQIGQAEGQIALYRMLQERDASAAARIQPNDRYRTARALEVLEATGRSLFSFKWPRETRKDMRILLIGLDRPREELYMRIDRRVRMMFRDGLVDEVKGLLERGYGVADPGLRGIGYREILQMRTGCETLSLVQDRIAQATRRYAKRQLTFFRAVPGVAWANPDDRDSIAATINSFIPAST